MSAPYGTGYGQTPYYLTPKVDFGWITESWQLFLKGAGTWIVLSLLSLLAYFVFYAIYVFLFFEMGQMAPITSIHSVHPSGMNPILAGILIAMDVLFYYVLEAYLTAVSYKLAVRQVSGEMIRVGDIFSGRVPYAQMILFLLIFSLAAAVGNMALCVGMFVVFGVLMPGGAMVAAGEKATEAITRSVNAMKGDWLNASLFALVFLLILSASYLLCLIGLFATIPMMYIISALAYRDMAGGPGWAPKTEFVQTPVPGPGVWPPPPSVDQTFRPGPFEQESRIDQPPQPPSGPGGSSFPVDGNP